MAFSVIVEVPNVPTDVEGITKVPAPAVIVTVPEVPVPVLAPDKV